MTLRRSPIERTAPWRMCRTCHRKGTKREKQPCSHPLKPVGKCGQCGERRPLVDCHRYNFEPLDRVDKMLRSGRKAVPKKRKPLRHKKRTREEFARIYGSKEKMAWIETCPCFARSIPGAGFCDGVIDPCHTETGGMAYKAGHETIVAGCRKHHRMFDEYEPPFDGVFRETVKMMAKLTTATWERILKAQEDDGREARESLHDRVSPHAS